MLIERRARVRPGLSVGHRAHPIAALALALLARCSSPVPQADSGSPDAAGDSATQDTGSSGPCADGSCPRVLQLAAGADPMMPRPAQGAPVAVAW